jgi:hypothetical protein
MESSTVIAFRAMVMLACLIIVPLAAIFGSQFPDVVKSVLIDRIWPPADKVVATDSLSQPDAPPFSTAPAPGWHSDTPPAANSAPGFNPSMGRAIPAAPAAIEPTSAWNSADSQVRHAMHEVPSVPSRDGNLPAATAGGMNPGAALSTPAQTDRFTWMEHRLRDFGASYYVLELLANGGERYRFFCQFPLANNPGRTRNFEATDTDPLRAMTRVVDQVEAWRTGRLQ